MTNEPQKYFVLTQVKELGYTLPEENVLVEPEGKNTLPAIVYGMKEIENRFGKSAVGIYSSDHVLDPAAMQTIAAAEPLTSEYLVTFGISPTHPHTGYGYVKPGEPLNCGFRVKEFREKPDLASAKTYIEEGCLWNSGMFLFDTDLFFSELRAHAPETFKAFFEANPPENSHISEISEIYSKLPKLSIDYGIMEKSAKVAVVKLEQRWNDLGNFSALYEEFEKDESGNCINACDSCVV